jgi:hypothetical protein
MLNRYKENEVYSLYDALFLFFGATLWYTCSLCERGLSHLFRNCSLGMAVHQMFQSEGQNDNNFLKLEHINELMIIFFLLEKTNNECT